MDDESLASWELVKHNEELMAKLSDGTATRTDQEKIESTMAAIEKRAEEKKALNTLTRKELMRKKDDLMWLVEKRTATRADAERLDNTLTAIEKRAEEKTALGTLTREELMRKNKDLMRLVGRGTATRVDAERLEDTLVAIEARAEEKKALSTLTREELMRKNKDLMRLVGRGTATRVDAERLEDTMDALKQEQKDRSSAKEETAALDREALMKRSAALMAVVGAGTATRCDKVHLEATMEAIEKAKADAEAVKTSMSMSDLIRRNEALMAKLKTGTATRAERERASDTTAEIERRTATNAKIAEESKTEELIMRNEALMKSLKEGTATKAGREELEAIMKRKEALDAELKRTTAQETKAKLTKARAELRLTERKTAVRDVMRMVKASERVDLCFMVDATGSMGSQIEAVKTQITKIATDVQITNPSLKLRTAITGYRDALERDGGNSPFDFVDSLEAFVSNVSSINAQGGGDGCEDVASGLADVLGFSWSRVLFFIADAPSHGARYHDGYNDNHTAGDHGIPAKLKQLQSMNIDVVFCRINPSTDKMVRVMNSDIGSVEDYIKTVTLNEPTKLTTHVTKSMRKSMHKTLTASRARTKLAGGSTSRLGGLAEVSEEKEELRTFSLTSSQPEWAMLPALSAKIYMNKKVVDISSLKSSGPLESMLVSAGTAISSLFSWGGRSSGGERCEIKVAPEPFATGNLRLARFGQILAGGTCGGEAASWQPCVFKDFKAKDKKTHTLERYIDEMEVNSVASALAAEFNRQHSPPNGSQMRYVLSSVATVDTDKGSRIYFAEPFLEGTFTRYSYNTGYWEEEKLDPWLLRFALWTYQVTSGFLMVADLQGIRTSAGYELTDPVILCTDLNRFGNTNLGPEMMERCKQSAEKHLADLEGRGVTTSAVDIS
jgi:hypothetical protein